MFLKGFIPLQLLILQLFWLRVCEEASQFGILTPNQSPVTCPKGGSFYAYVIQ